MPPKKAAAVSSVYIVVVNNGVNSVYTSEESAHAQLDSIKADSPASTTARIEVHLLQTGSAAAKKVVKDEEDVEAEAKPPTVKAKATKKAKVEDDGDDVQPKAPARAAKAAKPLTQNPKAKAIEETLPDNVKALLNGSSTVLSGLIIVVTGVPPTLGRQNAERLVMNYGGKLAKSISKNTDYVVVGKDTGPKKLEQIEDLGIRSINEDAFMAMLGEGGIAKRGAEDDEEPAAKKAKK